MFRLDKGIMNLNFKNIQWLEYNVKVLSPDYLLYAHSCQDLDVGLQRWAATSSAGSPKG